MEKNENSEAIEEHTRSEKQEKTTKAGEMRPLLTRGFTLVEMVVVLVIIAVLATLGLGALTGYIQKSNERKAVADCRYCLLAAQTMLQELQSQGIDLEEEVAFGNTEADPKTMQTALQNPGFLTASIGTQLRSLVEDTGADTKVGMDASGYYDDFVTMAGIDGEIVGMDVEYYVVIRLKYKSANKIQVLYQNGSYTIVKEDSEEEPDHDSEPDGNPPEGQENPEDPQAPEENQPTMSPVLPPATGGNSWEGAITQENVTDAYRDYILSTIQSFGSEDNAAKYTSQGSITYHYNNGNETISLGTVYNQNGDSLNEGDKDTSIPAAIKAYMQQHNLSQITLELKTVKNDIKGGKKFYDITGEFEVIVKEKN